MFTCIVARGAPATLRLAALRLLPTLLKLPGAGPNTVDAAAAASAGCIPACVACDGFSRSHTGCGSSGVCGVEGGGGGERGVSGGDDAVSPEVKTSNYSLHDKQQPREHEMDTCTPFSVAVALLFDLVAAATLPPPDVSITITPGVTTTIPSAATDAAVPSSSGGGGAIDGVVEGSFCPSPLHGRVFRLQAALCAPSAASSSFLLSTLAPAVVDVLRGLGHGGARRSSGALSSSSFSSSTSTSYSGGGGSGVGGGAFNSDLGSFDAIAAATHHSLSRSLAPVLVVAAAQQRRAYDLSSGEQVGHFLPLVVPPISSSPSATSVGWGAAVAAALSSAVGGGAAASSFSLALNSSSPPSPHTIDTLLGPQSGGIDNHYSSYSSFCKQDGGSCGGSAVNSSCWGMSLMEGSCSADDTTTSALATSPHRNALLYWAALSAVARSNAALWVLGGSTAGE